MLTEDLFTVLEAAELTRLKYWTIWDLLKKGRLMRTKVSGKTFIRRSELMKLIVDVSSTSGKAPKRRNRNAAAVGEVVRDDKSE